MAEIQTAAEKKPIVGKELKKIITRAYEGDESVLPQVREFFKDSTIVEAIGNVIPRAQQAMMERFIGKDLFLREAVLLKMAAMRESLNGANPNSLEELLVERVLSCWLHLHLLEWTYAQKEEMSLTLDDYY